MMVRCQVTRWAPSFTKMTVHMQFSFLGSKFFVRAELDHVNVLQVHTSTRTSKFKVKGHHFIIIFECI